MKSHRKILLFFVLFALYTCKSKPKELILVNEKLKSQKEYLLNKKITCLDKILGDFIISANHVIFLYNGFDCETCIDIGYRVSKTIDSLVQKQMVYIISTSANIGGNQLRNEYKNFVYNDEHDIIRRELRYIYTPVFILLDSMKKIDSMYYHNYNRNMKEENAFILNCLKKSKLNRI